MARACCWWPRVFFHRTDCGDHCWKEFAGADFSALNFILNLMFQSEAQDDREAKSVRNWQQMYDDALSWRCKSYTNKAWSSSASISHADWTTDGRSHKQRTDRSDPKPELRGTPKVTGQYLRQHWKPRWKMGSLFHLVRKTKMQDSTVPAIPSWPMCEDQFVSLTKFAGKKWEHAVQWSRVCFGVDTTIEVRISGAKSSGWYKLLVPTRLPCLHYTVDLGLLCAQCCTFCALPVRLGANLNG